MKSNRREFIKGALSGVFGALLTWAGAVRTKAEQVTQANRSTTTTASVSTSAEQSTPSTSAQAFAGIVENIVTDSIQVAPPQGTFIVDGVTWLVSVDDDGFSIISDDGGKTWQDPSELHSLTFVAPPDDLPDDLSDMAARWDTYWEIRGRGNAWCATSPNYGHFVHWSIDGSDEDGQGTFEDPVATEACAQSIADNPPFRV